MKKISKLLSLVLTIVFAVTLLTGCGGNETSGEITTVTFWSGHGHSKAFMEKFIEDYNNNQGKKDGIKIEFTYFSPDTFSKNVELAFENGTAPDLVSAASLKKNVENGNLLAINDLPGGEEYLDGFFAKHPEMKEEGNTDINGKTYCIPIAATTYGLAYNVQMFKDAGLVDEKGEPTPPKTIEEMREYAKILTDKSSQKYGIVIPAKNSNWVDNEIIYPAAVSCGHLDYDYVNGVFEFDQTKPYIKNIKNMIDDGSVFPGMYSLNDDQARAYFAEGKIGMKISASFDVAVWRDQFPAKIEWNVAPIPVLNENDSYKQRMFFEYSSLINSAALERVGAEKLMKVYKLFTSDEIIAQKYKEGIAISPYPEKVEGISLDFSGGDWIKNWKSFSDIVSISSAYPLWPTGDSSIVPKFNQYVSEILVGKLDLDAGIADYEAKREEAVDIYYQNRPDIEKKEADYVIKDWDVKR